jgi:hypothetical protein
MELDELKKAFTDKTKEFDEAMEAGRPHEELLSLYKELKELQFAMVKAELDEPVTG